MRPDYIALPLLQPLCSALYPF